MTLGQVKTADKSNEITAIPQLLNLPDVRGATVTIDAMGCQREIVTQEVQAQPGRLEHHSPAGVLGSAGTAPAIGVGSLGVAEFDG